MGVGCEEAGVCFAAAHDEPWRCSLHPRKPTEIENLISDLRHQARHVDHPDDNPTNGDLMLKAATLLQQAAGWVEPNVTAALEMAREALRTSYNVTTYPGDGRTPQDKAIAAIDAILSASPVHPQGS
ncbi:hypothetical protein ASG62_16425 [Aureimonas sp. Leaf427]|nr:hypothetical protein ASG62_16425 [Aureimonas sp. Leaf427]